MTHPREDKKVNKHWVIDVASWGTMYMIGTEEQAEEMRRHKARWEQSVATKRLADAQEIKSEDWKLLSDYL